MSENDEESSYPPVTLYTKPNCPGCNLVKTKLAEAGVEFEVVDITENDEAYTYVTQVLGAQGVPVIVSEDLEPIIGFRRERLRELIERYGAK